MSHSTHTESNLGASVGRQIKCLTFFVEFLSKISEFVYVFKLFCRYKPAE